MRNWRWALSFAALAAASCATKGDVRRAVAEARTQTTAEIEAERQARMAADTELSNTLRTEMQTEIAAMRRDLEALRSEFGTRITAMEDGVRFLMPVHFAFDDATVRPEADSVLARFADVVNKHYPTSTITVEGFADPAGSQSYNLELSRRRADAVRAELLEKGVDGARLRSIGYGKSRLVVPGAWGELEGAEMNRRVVFVIESAGLPPGFVATTEPPTNR